MTHRHSRSGWPFALVVALIASVVLAGCSAQENVDITQWDGESVPCADMYFFAGIAVESGGWAQECWEFESDSLNPDDLLEEFAATVMARKDSAVLVHSGCSTVSDSFHVAICSSVHVEHDDADSQLQIAFRPVINRAGLDGIEPDGDA